MSYLEDPQSGVQVESSFYSFLPESPHWLIQHMDYDRIELYIKTANRWNNKVVDVDSCRRDGPPPVEKRETCGEILKSPEMLKLLFINGFIQFVMAFYYFGLSLLSVDLSSDRFTAYMLSAFVELPSRRRKPSFTVAKTAIMCEL
ncbi:hypothetical protein TELCIR_02179 [Teladorsagia circumcincta]|uniref:Major facilitator superfamily (MFS) profile domain-containing protein n=1 Tax=Teladorsagia circumcincta TaxID=45464 RepID=A0A2G9UZU4_TELCI|nr:hypothetical protein TELCIR_02179 [Teladorsagia circumcincta]